MSNSWKENPEAAFAGDFSPTLPSTGEPRDLIGKECRE